MKRVPQGMVVVAEQHSASSCVAELYTEIKIKLVAFILFYHKFLNLKTLLQDMPIYFKEQKLPEDA